MAPVSTRAALCLPPVASYFMSSHLISFHMTLSHSLQNGSHMSETLCLLSSLSRDILPL